MKKMLSAAVALTLAACSVAGCAGQAGGEIASPVSAAPTLLDEKGLYTVENAYRTLLSGVDSAINAGLLKPGSPLALSIDSKLDGLRLVIQRAEDDQKALNGNDLVAQIAAARNAIIDLRSLIPGLPAIPGF